MARQLTLASFVEALTGWHPPGLEMPVWPIIDSREAKAGSLFFAFEGEHVDGHDFVQDALQRGAVGAVIEHDVTLDRHEGKVLDLSRPLDRSRALRPPLVVRVSRVLEALQGSARWWRQQLPVRVIGITGSVGKTTTKELVAQVLEKRYRVSRNPASYNNELGLPLTLLRLDATVERAVLEMGMYVPGDIRFLAELAHPDVGIVTNVAPVHAERAGSLDAIARGKRELVESLPAAPRGVAILNQDDPRVREMAAYTQARVMTYGTSPEAHLWADEVELMGLRGVRMTLHEGKTSVPVEASLLGRHSVYAVLRAAAAGLVEGLTWEEIRAGLASRGPRPRMVVKQGRDGIVLIDDAYNASPPSVLAALDFLAELPHAGRRVAVLGDMLELGPYEQEGHRQVGLRAAEVLSELVVVGEAARLIAEGARSRGMSAARVHWAADSGQAVDVVSSILRPGDLVLVKGSRAIHLEQVVDALCDEEATIESSADA